MEDSERYEALSPTETAALRKRSRTSLNLVVLMVALLIGVTAWGAWKASWGVVIAIVILGLLGVWFASREHLRSIRSLSRDIREGRKKIVVARVESQRQDIKETDTSSAAVDDNIPLSNPTMSYAYLVKVGGKELKVSETQYYKCKPGQPVEIHLAPHSEHVFSLKALED